MNTFKSWWLPTREAVSFVPGSKVKKFVAYVIYNYFLPRYGLGLGLAIVVNVVIRQLQAGKSMPDKVKLSKTVFKQISSLTVVFCGHCTCDIEGQWLNITTKAVRRRALVTPRVVKPNFSDYQSCVIHLVPCPRHYKRPLMFPRDDRWRGARSGARDDDGCVDYSSHVSAYGHNDRLTAVHVCYIYLARWNDWSSRPWRWIHVERLSVLEILDKGYVTCFP